MIAIPSLILLHPFAGEEPTMYELQYLRSEGGNVTVRIIEQVQSDWKELVDYFKLPMETVEKEMAKPGWTPKDACRNVFVTWLQGQGRSPKTWATVIDVLKEIGRYVKLIDEIRLILGSKQ